MQESLPQKVHQHTKNNARRRRWQKLVTALACVVVFCTTYALILPAVTMGDGTNCGMEEHTHTEECYTSVLICTQEEGTPAHEHTDECYTTPMVLTCGMEEKAGHMHTEACYETVQTLICTLEEGEEHTHTEECYQTESVLICTEEECEGHTHSEACYSVCAEDHEHTEECYVNNRVLVCTESTESTEVHTHTEDCYEKQLTCTVPEHTHTAACYADATADLESASVWERTIPTDLGDNWAENVVAVAQSQLGYCESTSNYIVNDDGVILGYTRYGAWYGDWYGDWCAMFASFCIHYAGVPEESFPYESGCQRWIEKLSELGLYRSADGYTPKAGDVVFFDNSGSGTAGHVGIVSESGTENDIAYIKTIEGNLAERVATGYYELSNGSILGYGVLPEQTETEIEDTAAEITKMAVIYTDETYTVVSDDETIITLTGALPEDAEVVAYPKNAEIDDLICAYDITILLPDGSSFEPDAEHPISVCIRIPEEDSQNEMTVCYVPDEGDIEQIPTEYDENGLSFEASHFSTYAVVAASTTGVSTLDSLRTAFNNAANGDVIQLTGDITISYGNNLPLTLSENKAVTLDLNGHHITYNNNVNKRLFRVTNGSLTIRDSAGSSSGKSFNYKVMHSEVNNAAKGSTTESTQTYTVTTNGYISGSSAAIVTVSGGSFTLESGLLCDGTGRAVDQSGGTVNLAGGYISGFTKTSSNINNNDGFGGAVRVSGGTLNLSGTVLCNNKAPNGGAIYNNGATVNMTGGVISGNTSTRSTTTWNEHSENSDLRCGGGGIYADGASVTNVSSGYISYNTVTDTGYFDGGGGIFFTGTSTVNFTGGYITGNTAAGGGGIRSDFRKDALGQTTKFTMSGNAHLSGNTATAAEGGGANFDRNCYASVTGGYVTNNTCTQDTHWGGGGLFCADGSTLYLKSALITENKAGGFGAGIGGCPTGHLYLYVTQGCAIYDNTAAGQNYVTGGVKQIDESRVEAYPSFLQNGYADFFCALNSSVIGTMLGDNSANWQGTADGKVVSPEKDAVVSASQLMGLTAHPTDAAKETAESLAVLYINGNSSKTHGGGIMCNGNLVVGEPKDIINPAYLTVKGTKQLLKGTEAQSLKEKTFTFEISDANGTSVTTGTSDEYGSITFSSPLEFKEPGTYTYCIRETAGDDSTVTYDTTVYRLTVTVVKDNGTALYGETKVYNCQISGTALDVSTDNGSTWESTAAAVSDGVLTLPNRNGASFTNEESDTIELKVRKVWKNEVDQIVQPDDDTPRIEVTLYQDGKELDKQTLYSGNNWSYTWKNLEKDHTYEVKETKVEGYNVSYETAEDGTFVITNTKVSSVVLPETGGIGTLPFIIGGLLLTVGSCLCSLILWRKKGRRSV